MESASGEFETTPGNPLTFLVHAYYSDGTDKYLHEGVSWSSDDDSIASVDDNGTVTPVAVGNTTIYARPDIGGICYSTVYVRAE